MARNLYRTNRAKYASKKGTKANCHRRRSRHPPNGNTQGGVVGPSWGILVRFCFRGGWGVVVNPSRAVLLFSDQEYARIMYPKNQGCLTPRTYHLHPHFHANLTRVIRVAGGACLTRKR
jgi:hypothetical protein